MCRLLAIASSELIDYRVVLRDAPRSLAVLSREHRDGWGVAVFDEGNPWRIERGVLTAHEDQRFAEVAVGHRGRTLVAHVRQKTVGQTSMENTHPFVRSGWVFAHNGTIKRIPSIEGRASKSRLAEVKGETDSERLFAAILTRFDLAGLDEGEATSQTDSVLRELVHELYDIEAIGSFNFILSNGTVTYAHRLGRSLFMLTRGHGDRITSSRLSTDGRVSIETPWSERRLAVLVASEALTDEPWVELGDRTLVRLDLDSLPDYSVLSSSAE